MRPILLSLAFVCLVAIVGGLAYLGMQSRPPVPLPAAPRA